VQRRAGDGHLMSFARASALTRVDDDTWRGEIPPGWDILDKANGGFLLGIAARSGVLASGRPDPVTITGHFLAPASIGPITVESQILKAGRRFATVRSEIFSGEGRRLLAALGSYGELAPSNAPERVAARPPDLPPVDECIRVEPSATFPPPFMGRVDLRLHPADVPTGTRGAGGRIQLRGWFRWRDSEPLDTVGLIVAADAFPPTAFSADLPVGWVPTLELTTHVRERPVPDDWLRCSFTTRFISGGFIEEDGELWAESGRLIAQSRQLALISRGGS